jgi:hypothetical protein
MTALHPKSRIWVWLVLGLLAFSGILLIFYCTRWDPWVLSDGGVYLDAARNLINGRGFGTYRPSGRFIPLTHFPPAFPLALSLLGSLGVEGLAAARWLNAILFGSNLFLLSGSLYRVTGWPWTSIALGAVILSSPIIIYLHSGVMSEPLFLFATALGLLFGAWYLRSGSRKHLLAGAVMTSLAFLTRYSGAALVITLGLSMMIVFWRERRKAILDVLLFGLIGVGPLIARIAILRYKYGMVAPRLFVTNFDGLWERLQPVRGAIVNVGWEWIPGSTALSHLPYAGKLGVLAFLCLGILLLQRRGWRRMRASGSSSEERTAQLGANLLLLYAAVYLVFLASSYVVSFIQPFLDQRMFLPVYLALLVSFILILFINFSAPPARKWVQAFTVVLLALIVSADSPVSLIRDLNENGHGFTSLTWKKSQTIQAVKGLPEDTIIISNEEEAVKFLTGRVSYDLPETRRVEPLAEFYRFGEDRTDDIQSIFVEKDAALVLFDSVYWELERIYAERTGERLSALTQGLRLYGDYADGAIYFYAGSPADG